MTASVLADVQREEHVFYTRGSKLQTGVGEWHSRMACLISSFQSMNPDTKLYWELGKYQK